MQQQTLPARHSRTVLWPQSEDWDNPFGSNGYTNPINWDRTSPATLNTAHACKACGIKGQGFCHVKTNDLNGGSRNAAKGTGKFTGTNKGQEGWFSVENK